MALSRYQQAASGFIPIRSKSGSRSGTAYAAARESVRPVAAPTDPFTQVGPTQRSPLWDVARALQEFEGSLSSLINRKQGEAAEADALRAEAAFYQNNQQTYAEAVESGAIPPYASPAFAKSYKAAEGRKLARDFATQMEIGYANWEDKDLDDTPDRFAGWIGPQAEAVLRGVTDPEILRGAIPGIRSTVDRLSAIHDKRVSDNVMNRAVVSVGKDIVGAVDNAFAETGGVGADGIAIEPKDPDQAYTEISEAALAAIDQGRSIGVPEDRLHKVAADSIVAQAIQRRDFELLGAIPDEVAKTPYAAKLIAEAHDKIATRIEQDEARAERAEKRDRDRSKETAIRQVIAAFSEDLDADLPDDLLALGEKGQADFRIKVEDMRAKMRKNATTVRPEDENAAAIRIHTAADPIAQAVKEIEDGNIGSPGRANSLLYTAQRLKQSREAGSKSILSSPATKQFEKAIKGRFTTRDRFTNASTVDEQGYGSALVDYHIALTEWEATNVDASAVERMKAAREIGEEYIKSLEVGGQENGNIDNGGGSQGTGDAGGSRSPAGREGSAAGGPNQGDQQPAQGTGADPQAAIGSEPADGSNPGPDPRLAAFRAANPDLASLPDDVLTGMLSATLGAAPVPATTPAANAQVAPGVPSPPPAATQGSEGSPDLSSQGRPLTTAPSQAQPAQPTESPDAAPSLPGGDLSSVVQPMVDMLAGMAPAEAITAPVQTPEMSAEIEELSPAEATTAPVQTPEMSAEIEELSVDDLLRTATPEQRERLRAMAAVEATTGARGPVTELALRELDERLSRLAPATAGEVAGDGEALGTVSAKYESGGRGVGFISTGANDPGGQSYGVHQLSGAYSMGAFLRSKEGAPYRARFAGTRPMTPAFNRIYKQIAAADPQGFAAAQREFYTRTHYQPVAKHAEKLGFDTSNRGVQEALFSMGVQHGRAKTIVSRAAHAARSTPEQQILALYNARSKYVQGLRSLPGVTKRSVLNRYKREVKDALAYARRSQTQPLNVAEAQ